MLDELRQQIQNNLAPMCEAACVEIVELNVRQQKKNIAIQVLADTDNGITVDECAKINRFLIDTIEREQLVDGEYTVEVSSPGLDRPLCTRRDFEKVVGKEVRFHLLDFIDGKKEHAVIVAQVNEGNVVVEHNGQELIIPLSMIGKAVQII